MENYSLTAKLLGKPFVQSKTVLGLLVEYRILTNPERVEVWKKIPGADLLSAPEAMAIPTLARAIVSIDGVPWEKFAEIQELQKVDTNKATVDLVEVHLSKYPYPTINELYAGYLDVSTDYQQQLEDLKKNSKVTNPEPSGQSAKPSEKTQ